MFTFFKLAVPAIAVRQAGLTYATGFSYVDRYVIGHFHGPKFELKPLLPFVSWANRRKDFETSGNSS